MSFISSTIGTAGTTILGKSMVSICFKINTGSWNWCWWNDIWINSKSFDNSVREAYIKFMEMIYKGELKKFSYDQNGQAISKMFKKN